MNVEELTQCRKTAITWLRITVADNGPVKDVLYWSRSVTYWDSELKRTIARKKGAS